MSEFRLYASTRKGLFTFRTDDSRSGWTTDGPALEGWTVAHCIEDPRDPDRVYVAASHPVWGPRLSRSFDGGRSWDEAGSTPAFPPETETVQSIWMVQPGHAQRPGEVWAGVEAANLFRSRYWGATWELVRPVYDHATRSLWSAGGGGLILHGLLQDQDNPSSLIATVSSGGAFRSDDDGASWKAINAGVAADFLPDATVEAGHCPHHMVRSPQDQNWLFQQNHCGQYASADGGETWQDVSAGLPSRFGFASAIHPRERCTVYVAPLDSDMLRAFPGGALKVYRSRDGGGNWEPLTRGLPQQNAWLSCYRQAMTSDAGDPAGIYLGTSTGQIFYSRDEGDSWQLLADFLPPITALEIAAVAA